MRRWDEKTMTKRGKSFTFINEDNLKGQKLTTTKKDADCSWPHEIRI